MENRPEAPLEEPEWIFPYSGMSVGDSFFVPTMKPAYMTYIIDTTAKRVGMKMRCYATIRDGDGVMGVRAWRIR